MKYCDLVKELEKYSLEDLKNLLTRNLERDNTFNIFQNINMREDSHTKLLAWLLNNKCKGNCHAKSIQYYFLCNFIEYLTDWGYIEKIDNIEQYVEKLSCDLCVQTQYPYKLKNGNSNNIDLLMYSLNQKFVCIIENKLDAKICTDSNGITQLEKYKSYIENEFIKNNFADTSNVKIIYLFLSSYDLTNKQVKTVCDKGSNGEIILSANGEVITDKKFKYLLCDSLKYKTIEHSDIVIMIYQALKQIGYDYRTAITKEDILTILTSIIDNYNVNEQNIEILQALKNSIEYKKQCKEKPSNFNIDIDNILNEFVKSNRQDLILKILSQYIAYWECYNEFVSGYTEIIETQINNKTYGIYKWDIEAILKEKYSKQCVIV